MNTVLNITLRILNNLQSSHQSKVDLKVPPSGHSHRAPMNQKMSTTHTFAPMVTFCFSSSALTDESYRQHSCKFGFTDMINSVHLEIQKSCRFLHAKQCSTSISVFLYSNYVIGAQRHVSLHLHSRFTTGRKE